MSQNDLVIANQAFPPFRADLNSALQALGSANSGTTEPATIYANMFWYDTTAKILKLRSEANDAWISVGYFDQSANAFRILDNTQVTDTSGTQTGLLGDQATATWEAGTSTIESLVSPAKVKAAAGSLGGPQLLGSFSHDSSGGITITDIPDIGNGFFDDYIEAYLLFTLVTTNGDGRIEIQYSTDNGSSFITSRYQWACDGRNSSGTAVNGNSTEDTKWVITPSDVDSLSGNAAMGRVYLSSYGDSRIWGQMTYGDPSGRVVTSNFAGNTNDGSSGFNALRITGAGAVSTQGTVHLFVTPKP